jgi:hypothetical protein
LRETLVAAGATNRRTPAVSVPGMHLLAVSAGLEAAGGFLVLAVGYGGCFALWHFVFSPRNRHDDDLDRTRSEEFLE